MKLYSESIGHGPELVLIHGWGAHSAVWSGLRKKLAETFRVTTIDLPGHGNSPYQAGVMDSLPAVAEAVLAVAPTEASWLGWSLGGLIVQQAALLEAGRFEKIILLGSTPSFITRDDWPYAVDQAVLENFHQELRKDSRATLLRFIALQTRGSQQAANDARLLRQLLLEPAPDNAALEAGLNLLQQSDMREQLAMIDAPVLLLSGARDTLLPAKALPEITGLFKDARFTLIDKAGHAPFLSHKDETFTLVNEFLTQPQIVKSRHAR